MAKQDKDIFIKRFGEVMGAATQKQFAEKLHTTQTTISKILNGKSDPSLEILKTIVEEYGVSLDWLLGLCEEKYIHNVSVHKLTYPYVLSVFYELLQGGNISVKITSNENSDVPDTWEDRLYGHEQNCALILKDVVLKELMLKLNSDIRISKKAAESWKDSVSDDFKELLDWNDEKTRAAFALYQYEPFTSLLAMYKQATEDILLTSTLPEIEIPSLEKLFENAPEIVSK
ncbi:MAG: helix-turn-helix transcriptional regulator [Lachnospiraceae bacterium]|nr:helix-turn-helix transcriptional regulator [Lachnospiraceae bacterium]